MSADTMTLDVFEIAGVEVAGRIKGPVHIKGETKFISIPANTKPSQCTSCGKTIYWTESAKNHKPLPVSVAHISAFAPTYTTCGQGIAHFADCVDGAKWSGHPRRQAPNLRVIR